MQPYAAPLPPYAVHAPVTLAPPAPAPAPVPTTVPIHLPPIQYRAVASPPTSTSRERREIGLLVAGAALLFTAVLLLIAFTVQTRTYAGLDAHWAANASLVAEARELGLRAVKQSTLLRMIAFGPTGLAMTIGGIVALVKGARRR